MKSPRSGSARSKRKRHPLRRLMAGARRGQAMVEYAVVSALILGGLMAAGSIFLPDMIRAYNIYYKSFYAILNLPIP